MFWPHCEISPPLSLLKIFSEAQNSSFLAQNSSFLRKLFEFTSRKSIFFETPYFGIFALLLASFNGDKTFWNLANTFLTQCHTLQKGKLNCILDTTCTPFSTGPNSCNQDDSTSCHTQPRHIFEKAQTYAKVIKQLTMENWNTYYRVSQ